MYALLFCVAANPLTPEQSQSGATAEGREGFAIG